MQDRTIKVLLVVVSLLLFALLVRPQATTAQSSSVASPVVCVDNNLIYVVKDNKLSVYFTDAGLKLSQSLMSGDPQKGLKPLPSAKIYHLATKDLNVGEPPVESSKP